MYLVSVPKKVEIKNAKKSPMHTAMQTIAITAVIAYVCMAMVCMAVSEGSADSSSAEH